MIELGPCPYPKVLAAMHAESFQRPWTAAAFEDLLQSPGVMTFAAMADGEPLGFVLVRQLVDEAEILTIAVLPAARRSGVGGRLLHHVVSEIGGLHSLFIEVDVLNTGARAFYESLDFIQIGVRKNYYQLQDGSRSDAIVMRRGMP